MPLNPNVSQAVKQFLSPAEKDLFIGGKTVPAQSEKRIPVIDPATGETIASVPDASPADVHTAVINARETFDSGVWSDMPPVDREKRLLKLADLLESHAEELQHLIVLENGKLLSAAQREVSGSIKYVRYAAGWTTKIMGDTLDVSMTAPNTRYFAYTVLEPVGVVAGIIPWNFPLNMAVWKAAAALACGCTIVLKPSEEAPLSALRLAELAIEAGIPAGVLNVITGYGSTAGSALVSHKGINKIAFTGSTATGKIIGKAALDNMTRLSLELGGKSPAIVMPDADLSRVPADVAKGIFYNQGQVCVAGSRLYVHRSIFDTVVEQVGGIASKMRLGNGFDPDARIGPVVSKAQQERVMGYVSGGVESGGEVLVGGKMGIGRGYFVEPTVMINVPQESRIVQEEVFGPVLVALPFYDIDEVIRLANDSTMGLAATIYSNNLSHVHRLVKGIKAGTVFVNSPIRSDPNLPLGGYKESGFGREHGRSLIDLYTEQKSVVIAYDEE